MFGIDSSILILILLLSAFLFISQRTSKKNKIEKDSLTNKLRDFGSTKIISGAYGDAGVSINEISEQIMLFDKRGGSYEQIFLSYDDILSVELFEDKRSITKSVRSSMIGRALVGGALFGGPGAIIGGLTGKQKSTDKVNDIYVKIIVNDINNSSHSISFLESECNKGGIIYNAAINKARQCYDIMNIIIKRAEEKK